MKIAQIAPLQERVSPKLYGGTERVVSYLAEELVRQGHQVTLFASGDSNTKAELVPCCETALRLNVRVRDPLPHYVLQLEKVRQRANDFDVLHFHTDFLHFPLFLAVAERTLTTLHGRLDLPDLRPFYTEFTEFPLVSISHAQRWPMPPVNWLGTVQHGLPRDLLPFAATANGGYLAFLGRISPEKRPDRAIEIATRLAIPLKIAAKIDEADANYWAGVVRPMIDNNPLVEFVGEINEQRKAEFLGNALALLFPVDWPEPFGLVMIEAMACGTPTIAFRCGSVPEVIEDGVSGFVVNSMDEAVDAVRKLGSLGRAAVRQAFERRFTAECMARQYLSIYERLAGQRTHKRSLGNPSMLPATVGPDAALRPDCKRQRKPRRGPVQFAVPGRGTRQWGEVEPDRQQTGMVGAARSAGANRLVIESPGPSSPTAADPARCIRRAVFRTAAMRPG